MDALDATQYTCGSFHAEPCQNDLKPLQVRFVIGSMPLILSYSTNNNILHPMYRAFHPIHWAVTRLLSFPPDYWAFTRPLGLLPTTWHFTRLPGFHPTTRLSPNCWTATEFLGFQTTTEFSPSHWAFTRRLGFHPNHKFVLDK